MNGTDVEEFGGPAERSFRGESRGPGASLNGAIQQAAKAAAAAGAAGRSFVVDPIIIEPEEHNQWVRAFTVIVTEV
jgi:hypothetical protein